MRAAARRSRSAEGIGPVTADRPLGEVLEFLRALWGVNHALESTSRRMRSRFGVTGPERMVVRLVGRYPGISAGDLARILLVHPSTLTGLLKRLVTRGILTRRADAVDARRALFSLTPRGASLDVVKKGTVEAALTVALASLPARDVRATAAVLDRLTRTLEGIGQARQPPGSIASTRSRRRPVTPRARRSARRPASPSGRERRSPSPRAGPRAWR